MLNAIKTIRNRCNTLVPFWRAFPPGSGYWKTCFLCTGWIYATIKKKEEKTQTQNPDFTVIKQRTFFFSPRGNSLFTTVEEQMKLQTPRFQPEAIVTWVAVTTHVWISLNVHHLLLDRAKTRKGEKHGHVSHPTRCQEAAEALADCLTPIGSLLWAALGGLLHPGQDHVKDGDI